MKRKESFRKDGSYVPGYAALCASAYAPYMYSRGLYPTKPEDYVSGWEVMREMWVRRTDFRVEGNLKGFDFTEALSRVKLPALVVAGDSDMVSAGSTRRLAAALPNAQLHVMPRCGHMMFVDDPAQFNALVERFLSGS